MIIDTAGRLHTQTHLMEELSKVRRVVAKGMPGAPHETLMTFDATTGQNGVHQASRSSRPSGHGDGPHEARRDGKGRHRSAIANEFGIPVKLIGVGESARICSRLTPTTSPEPYLPHNAADTIGTRTWIPGCSG